MWYRRGGVPESSAVALSVLVNGSGDEQAQGIGHSQANLLDS